MTAPVVPLVDGTLYVLPCPYALDGRVSTHPDDARGFAPQQVYALLEPGAALIVETGFTVHEASVLERLDTLLSRGTVVSLFPLSLGEFRSVCNVRPIVERFDVRALYGPFQDGAAWVDFRPELVPPGEPVGAGKMAGIDVRLVSSAGGAIEIGEGGRRRVQALGAPLRLLPTHWLYDGDTRTLFTSDAFTHVWRQSADGPWLVTPEDDATSLEELVDYLLRTRFWWLAGADTQRLLDGLAAVFDAYDIETVAPSYGCVLHGREVVERHYELMRQALRELGERASVGLSAGGAGSRGGTA